MPEDDEGARTEARGEADEDEDEERERDEGEAEDEDDDGGETDGRAREDTPAPGGGWDAAGRRCAGAVEIRAGEGTPGPTEIRCVLCKQFGKKREAVRGGKAYAPLTVDWVSLDVCCCGGGPLKSLLFYFYCDDTAGCVASNASGTK